MQGNFYKSEMLYVEIKLWKCLNSTKAGTIYQNYTCKDKATIDSYFENETFSFAFINSVFAFDDY